MDKIIIYDSDHPGAIQNECFKDEYASMGPGHSFTVLLAKKASEKGYQMVTSDVFLKKKYSKEAIVFCITDMYSSNTNRVLRKGAIPILCFSTESPIIARDFYVNIQKLAGRFIYNIQFRGTLERLSRTPTQFSVMYYPIDNRVQLPYSDWAGRKLLVLINRNKRMFYSRYSTVKEALRSVLSPIKISLQKLVDPWIRSKEIYKDRIQIINYFSNNKEFYLYGHGWGDRIPGFSKGYSDAAKKAYHGTLRPDEKLSVMSQFKFAICFENCVFPGYVTEKIFDCMLAGCIPIYYGAPDIEDFVPANTFIDYRKFRDFKDLELYLSAFSEAEALQMLNSAKVFLGSENFDKYYTPNIVAAIINKIENATAKNKSLNNEFA